MSLEWLKNTGAYKDFNEEYSALNYRNFIECQERKYHSSDDYYNLIDKLTSEIKENYMAAFDRDVFRVKTSAFINAPAKDN